MKPSDILSSIPAAVLAISSALCALPSSAEGTWIEVFREIRTPKTGTNGEVFCKQYRYCGEAVYVDAASIVKRGDFVYYNWRLEFINQHGSKTWPDKPSKPRGIEANCRTKMVKTPKKGWLSWSEAGPWEGPAAEFACR